MNRRFPKRGPLFTRRGAVLIAVAAIVFTLLGCLSAIWLEGPSS